jgi:hypothetical protein
MEPVCGRLWRAANGTKISRHAAPTGRMEPVDIYSAAAASGPLSVRLRAHTVRFRCVVVTSLRRRARHI